MKPRRLCAILLLVALALLQVRAAFAECLVKDHGEREAAMPCCEAIAGGAGMGVSQDLACADHCLRANARQESTDAVPTAETRTPIPDLSIIGHVAAAPDPPLRRLLTRPQTAGHPLIYRLQRLLI